MKVKRLVLWIFGAIMILIALGLIYTAFNFNLTAQQQPGKVETYLATKAKHWLVARAVAREHLSSESGKNGSVARGQMLFDSCCSRCLGGGDSASGPLLGCSGPT